MMKAVVVFSLAMACVASLRAQGVAPATAVGKTFPTLEMALRAPLTSLLARLPEGQTIVIGFAGMSASFTAQQGKIVVDVRQGMPPLAQLPVSANPPAAPAGEPWKQAGTKAGEEIIGPDSGRYVWVPAGAFMMGTTDAEADVVTKTGGGSDWIRDEKPVHSVTISRGFWLSKYEVMNAQYREFCQATGRTFPPESNQGDDFPVVNVSWGDAKAYCARYGLGLPTEAEWEYAARGEKATVWPWGHDWDAASHSDADNPGPGGSTYPVGTFPDGASWCGATDMAGNAWEWCADWYDPAAYTAPPEVNPTGPAEGTKRVFRGGSCRSKAWVCRGALRNKDVPKTRLMDLGFRPIIAVE